MSHHSLDSLDKKILQLIAEDARIPFLEVARLCKVSGAAIHQRIQKLTHLGIIKGSQFVIDPESIGYDTTSSNRWDSRVASRSYHSTRSSTGRSP